MKSTGDAEFHPSTSKLLSVPHLLNLGEVVCQRCVAESQYSCHVKYTTSMKPSSHGGGPLTRLIRDCVKLKRSCWQRMTCMSAAAMYSLASVALEASLSDVPSSLTSQPTIAGLQDHKGC